MLSAMSFNYPKRIADFGCWYISRDIMSNETALCIQGADGLPVFCLPLAGDYFDELVEVANAYTSENNNFAKGTDATLGEVLRYVSKHPALIVERLGCVGSLSGRVRMVEWVRSDKK